MSISKSIRFGIFHRDGFTCQYCGLRPPDVVLEVDHIHPRSQGGEDEEINLITSCFDCNRGKGAKVLSERAVRPDADIGFLETQQEIAEARRFLQARADLEEIRPLLVDKIVQEWMAVVTDREVPTHKTVLLWLAKYSADEIITALSILGSVIARTPWKFSDTEKMISYAGGIMRGRREDRLV